MKDGKLRFKTCYKPADHENTRGNSWSESQGKWPHAHTLLDLLLKSCRWQEPHGQRVPRDPTLRHRWQRNSGNFLSHKHDKSSLQLKVPLRPAAGFRITSLYYIVCTFACPICGMFQVSTIYPDWCHHSLLLTQGEKGGGGFVKWSRVALLSGAGACWKYTAGQYCHVSSNDGGKQAVTASQQPMRGRLCSWTSRCCTIVVPQRAKCLCLSWLASPAWDKWGILICLSLRSEVRHCGTIQTVASYADSNKEKPSTSKLQVPIEHL